MSQSNAIHNPYEEEEEDDDTYQCRHIFTGGRRCGSPCLRNEHFCYFHHATRRPVENAAARKSRLGTFEFTWPEDRAALQVSLCQVLERIASNDLDPKRAGLLLYGLQIASQNLPRATAEAKPAPFVEEVELDETYGPLAPRATVDSLLPMGPADRLLAELLEDDEPRKVQTMQAVAEEAHRTIPSRPSGSRPPAPCISHNKSPRHRRLAPRRNGVRIGTYGDGERTRNMPDFCLPR
jgi:hypothetical protein